MTGAPPPLLLSVVRGDPSAAELAALVVVLAGRISHDAVAGPIRSSSWARSSFRGGAGSLPRDWRSSGLPT